MIEQLEKAKQPGLTRFEGLDQQISAEGILVECGVYQGRSINWLAEMFPDREIHGFDSFEGLPEAWNDRQLAGHFNLNGELPKVAENVTLHKGFFEDTLPDYDLGCIAFLHIDCDLYSSTKTVLENLGPWLFEGFSIVQLGEFWGYEGYEEHEYKAWHEWLEEMGTEVELLSTCRHSARFRV